MKLKVTAFLAAWLCLALNLANAQSKFKLSGTIAGADNATVYLIRAADSTTVKTAITEANGTYGFELIASGTYRLTVRMVGFETYQSAPFQLNKDTILQAIGLKPQNTALKEVTIQTSRPLIEHLIDRTVVNPEALISNAGGTVLDVLAKSPGVLVDDNDAISLKGKGGVKVYID